MSYLIENKKIVVVSCESDHRGVVITGSDRLYYDNRPVARIGDLHSCPRHGVTEIVETPQSTLYDDNRLVAVDGARAKCGAEIRGYSG